MAIMNTNFDPGRVLLGTPSRKQPYLPNPDAGRFGNFGHPPPVEASGNATAPRTDVPVPSLGQMQNNVLGSESVRSSGSGPFDSTYRQNLATYGGGQFARPGGNMSFNPTDASTFPGNPTGGGNAPLPGLPDSLISRAIGGNPFSFSPPQPAAITPATSDQPDIMDWQDWLRQMRQQGGGFGLYQ